MKMGPIEKFFVNSPTRSRQVSRRAEKLLKHADLKEGQKYLEVGCGNGAAPLLLARRYPLEVTGVDVDPDQIRAAQESSKDVSNVRFLTVDGTRLPFGDHEFDIVATYMTTHHIPNWDQALAEIVRVLKPNGYFIYKDLVYPGWLAAIGKKVAGNKGGYPTIRELEAFVGRNNLSKIHLSKSWVHYETVCQRLS